MPDLRDCGDPGRKVRRMLGNFALMPFPLIFRCFWREASPSMGSKTHRIKSKTQKKEEKISANPLKKIQGTRSIFTSAVLIQFYFTAGIRGVLPLKQHETTRKMASH
jgi:hypothetical protein